ncbi:hypothetical protein [uncultured Paracoccus sp.]|uniref:hypothetical protein n=1 Tax=uncultured Paracoccus sp. TaxID=189685 RepID=UPI00261AEC54|nr:hypothetical protein [uncultured Paracoccus sp.]
MFTPLFRRALLPGLLSASVLALAACTMTTGATNPPASNAFYAQLSQTGFSGRYDPAGFQPHEVQKALGEACAIRGNIVDYVEQPVDGAIAFRARCRGGTDVRLGTVSVYRYGNRARVVLPGYVEIMREDETVRTISL